MADPIAVYGAVIGTAAALGAMWSIYNGAFQDRARLRVQFGREFHPGKDAPFTILSPDPRNWPETESWYPSSERRAHIHVANVGKRPITVIEAGVEFPNGVRAAFEPGNSAQLLEGEYLLFSISEESLAEIVGVAVPNHVYAIDASTKIHRRRIEPRLRPWLEHLRQQSVKPT